MGENGAAWQAAPFYCEKRNGKAMPFFPRRRQIVMRLKYYSPAVSVHYDWPSKCLLTVECQNVGGRRGQILTCPLLHLLRGRNAQRAHIAAGLVHHSGADLRQARHWRDGYPHSQTFLHQLLAILRRNVEPDTVCC